jgi:hypothetical protein
MRRKMNKYVWPLIVIFVAAVIIGYHEWNKPHKDIKNAEAVEASAVALYNVLAHDSINAKIKFINKVVAVSGRVKQLSENQKNQQIVLLRTNIYDGSVNCTMEENIPNIKVGDTILIRGICIGYSGGDSSIGMPGDVFLIRCYPSI